MKFPSPWHANAAVCARAFIKPVAVRQSGLCRAVTFAACSPFGPSITSNSTCRAFRQRAEAAGLNRAEVDEHILAPAQS